MKKLTALMLALLLAITMVGNAFASEEDAVAFYAMGTFNEETEEIDALPYAMTLYILGEDTLMLIAGDNETVIYGTYVPIEDAEEENTFIVTLEGLEEPTVMYVDAETMMVGLAIPEMGTVLFSQTPAVELAEINTAATLADYDGGWDLYCILAYGMVLDAEAAAEQFGEMGLTEMTCVIENGSVALLGSEAEECTLEADGTLAKRYGIEGTPELDTVLNLRVDGTLTAEVMGMTMVFIKAE